MLLTLNERPSDGVLTLAARLAPGTPVISVVSTSFPTAAELFSLEGKLNAATPRKAETALGLFERYVDTGDLLRRVSAPSSDRLTPMMFEHTLLEQARSDKRRIVLPEGTEPRVLHAAEVLLRRGVCELTLLGAEDQIRKRAADLGIDLTAAQLIDPHTSQLRDRFAEKYAELRAHKGVTVELAYDVVADVNYFGTLMVQEGLADGMVSGAVHSTAATIRPAFEIIKTKPDADIVSSVFFMCLADKVLVYGDCAVNPDPNAEQLADIAIQSAATAEQFGVGARIAMLSYSTGTSGSGIDVDKVREATELVRLRRPDLRIEGPIQYDAAVEPSVAATKLPESEVAGQASVLIFPDLNTGNNTYKAVQRSSRRDRGRAGPPGAAQAGQRPVPGRPRLGHRQHRRHHGDPGSDPEREGFPAVTATRVLVLNSGSSSVKYQLLDMAVAPVSRSGSSSGSARRPPVSSTPTSPRTPSVSGPGRSSITRPRSRPWRRN